MRRQIFYLALFLLLFIPAVVAQGSQATVATIEPIPEPDGSVTVLISGTVPNSCVDVESVSYQINNDQIVITVETSRPDPTVMCAQALEEFTAEVVIPAGELAAGDYTITAGRISIPFSYEGATNGESTGEPAPEPTESSQLVESIPAACPLPDEEQSLFVDPDEAYCFVYPAAFESVEDETAQVSLVRNDEDPDNQLTVFFSIEAYDTNREVAQELQADMEAALLNAEGKRVVENTTFAEHPAIRIEARRGELAAQRVYVIHPDAFYIFAVAPAPSVDDEAAAFWEVVSESFTFLDAE